MLLTIYVKNGQCYPACHGKITINGMYMEYTIIWIFMFVSLIIMMEYKLSINYKSCSLVYSYDNGRTPKENVWKILYRTSNKVSQAVTCMSRFTGF